MGDELIYAAIMPLMTLTNRVDFGQRKECINYFEDIK